MFLSNWGPRAPGSLWTHNWKPKAIKGLLRLIFVTLQEAFFKELCDFVKALFCLERLDFG